MDLMDFFRPKWRHSDPKVRLAAVEKLDDQKKIAEVVSIEKDWTVRAAAFERLTDPVLIKEILEKHSLFYDCPCGEPAEFIQILSDQRALAIIAQKGPTWRERKAAVSRLSDQELLMDIIGNNDENIVVRLEVIGRLTDDAALAGIARTNKDWNLRLAAVKIMTDPALLAEIAQMDREERVRSTATEKLTDPLVLAEIARTDRHEEVRCSAWKMLGTAEREAVKPWISSDAVSEIRDNALLIRIARNAGAFYVRQKAVEKIADQDVLAAIAGTDENSSVREAAVNKISDQSLLVEIVRKSYSNSIDCEAAIEKIDDLVVLAEIARNHSNCSSRSAAVKKLTDLDLLADIAKSDDNPYVRKTALEKVEDQSLLVSIAKTDSEREVRKAAVKKLVDLNVLAEIAKKDADMRVRDTAAKRMESLKPRAASDKGQVHPECLRAQEIGRSDPMQGRQILDKLLSREPKAGGAYNLYGQLSMDIGDLSTARDAFERDIAYNPEGDHRYNWAYLALVIGLQGDESKACECAKRTSIKIQYDFAENVRNAYIAWLQRNGRTPSQLRELPE
jgi:tetratricopeptide (TPR) repeat protein